MRIAHTDLTYTKGAYHLTFMTTPNPDFFQDLQGPFHGSKIAVGVSGTPYVPSLTYAHIMMPSY